MSFFPDIFLKENGGISPWQLHFAASLSSTDNTTIIEEDDHTIIALQPEIVQSSATTDFTPFYCAIAVSVHSSGSYALFCTLVVHNLYIHLSGIHLN